MPYTLKTQQIAVKDPDTGVYSGVDILAEQTTEGLLTEITATGEAVKADVSSQMATERSDFNIYVITKEAELDQYKSTTETNINTYVTNKNQEITTMIAKADEDVSDLEDRKQDVADAVAGMLSKGVDNTLTTANVPAESKATGDLFETIVEGKSTQPNDKWNRLWIKPSASDYEIPTFDEFNAVSKQAGFEILTSWVPGYYACGSSVTSVDITSSESITENDNYVCQVVECNPGDYFLYNGFANSQARPIAFLSAASGENNIASKIPYSGAFEKDLVIMAPSNARYLISNARKAYNYQLLHFKEKHNINPNTDLNDLKSPGVYYNMVAANALTISNLPDYIVSMFSDGVQFSMKISPLRRDGSYISQTLYTVTKNTANIKTFIREYTTAWSKWKEILYEQDHNYLEIQDLALLTDGVNLNDIVEVGSYYCPNATSAITMVNSPLFIGSSFSLYVVKSKEGTSQSSYVRQILFANKKELSSIYTRALNREWGEWQLLANCDMLNAPLIKKSSAFIIKPHLMTPIKKTLKIATNNVAHYWLQGNQISHLSDYPIRIDKWKRFLMKANVDILMLQECEDYLDLDQRVSAFDTLYASFFDSDTNTDTGSAPGANHNIRVDNPARRKILNRLGLNTNSELGVINTLDSTYNKNGYYNWCVVNIDDVGSVTLMNIHNFTGSETNRVLDRAYYLEQIKNRINSLASDYFILAGDFNISTDEDMANLLNFCNLVNATPANGGIIGWFSTSSTEDAVRPYDNIIVSNNIEFCDIECNPTLVVTKALHTDHNPVVATINFH